MRTREPSHTPDFRLDYHPWSQFPPTADGERELNYSEITAAEFKLFEENYESLIKGLTSLPKLKTIRYAGRATIPGFCAVSDNTVVLHGRSRDTWQTSFVSEGQPRMHWALRTIWWSDAEDFKALVSSLRNTIEYIDIQQPMPAIKKYADGLIRGSTVDRQKALWRNIEFGGNLSHFNILWPGLTGWHAFLKRLLHDASGLRTLDIELTSIMDEESMKARQATDSRDFNFSQLWEEEGRRMHRFDPRGFAVASQLNTVKIRCGSRFPYPLLANWAMVFLRHHSSSLQHVFFENIIFYQATDDGFLNGSAGIVSAAAGMKLVIGGMRDLLKLESALIRVPRIGCDERCDFATSGNHTIACEAYPLADAWFNVKVLDDLAAEYKIKPKDGSWDFGQAVMRKQPRQTAETG